MNRKSLLTGGVIAMSTALVFAGCQQAAAPQKAPEQVVKDAMKNLTNVTSNQFELAVNGDLTGPQGETPNKVKFNVTLAGSSDLKDLMDPKINLKFDGSGNADAQSASGSAELRMNKDTLYFTLSKVDMQGGEAIPKEFTDMYVGKWWKLPIPADTLKEFTANLPEGGSQQTLTPAQQKLKDEFENTQFFTNIKFVGTEDVKGLSSYHYTADLDKTAVMNFMTQASAEQGSAMTDSDKKDMTDAMAKFDFTGNLWVDSASGNLDQVSGDLKFTHPTASDPTGTVTIRGTMWAFNQPVTVTAPAGATDFPVESLMGGLMGGASMGGDMSTLDSGSMMGSEEMTTGDDQSRIMDPTSASQQAIDANAGDNGDY